MMVKTLGIPHRCDLAPLFAVLLPVEGLAVGEVAFM